MFGVIIGTVCLIALFGALRRHHYPYYAGFGWHSRWAGCGPGYFGSPAWRVRRGRRRRFAARWLFEQLDTTPGQEKTILKSVASLQDNLAAGRSELRTARKELAQALGGDVLDQSLLESALGRVDAVLGKARSELVLSLGEIHAALDGRQRRTLAELIADFNGHRFAYDDEY